MKPHETPTGELHRRRTEWLRGGGDASDVVLSSRVRLARNLAGLPFVNKATRADLAVVLERCRDAVLDVGLGERTLWVDLRESSAIDRALLLERRLISHTLASNPKRHGTTNVGDPRGVAASIPDERLAVMVNEEDHLRLQAIRCGLALGEAHAAVDALDDQLEARMDFAFSPRFGYLTACPTNVGTGARFSVMLHLPALSITGDIERVKRAAGDMSLAVRGFAGEGTESVGDFFQLSNQTTLGRSEDAIRDAFERRVVPQVIEYERQARRRLIETRRVELEDRVYRALALLREARLMTTEEAMRHLSVVRLGVTLGVLTSPSLEEVHALLLLVQPAHLQRLIGRAMTKEQRRVERAILTRSRFGGEARDGSAERAQG